MQDEIAASPVRALQVEVGAAYGIVSRPLVRNSEAYKLYLQGAHANNRFDQQGFEQAASYYQRALDLNPTFANAAAGIAAAYDNLGEFLMMPPAVAFEQAGMPRNMRLRSTQSMRSHTHCSETFTMCTIGIGLPPNGN
jgi:hypothetical protein